MPVPSSKTRGVIEAVFDKLSPERIGDVYCDEGGADFFTTMRPRIIEDGVEWAEALTKRLRKTDRSPHSLYVGAGLAELPALLVEALDLERRLIVTNLRTEECELLNDALHRADVKHKQLRFVPENAADRVGDRSISHVSLVSVLTDPETYPTVSALEYGRMPIVLLDTVEFERERKTIRNLLDGIFTNLEKGAIVTTTAEETPWVLDWAGRVSPARYVTPDDAALRSAVVGDPIGFLEVQ